MPRGSRGRGHNLPPRTISTRGSTPAVEAEVVQSVQVATAEDSPSVLDINLEHTQGGNQDATAEDPPAAAPRRRPRGRTTVSCETSVAAGNPKPVVELLDGNPVGHNAKIFKSTAFSWLKTPTVVSQGVTGFSKLTYHDLNNFWTRVKDCFEFVEVAIDGGNMIIVPPPPPPSSPTPTASSTPSSSRDPGTSSIASTPTQRPTHLDPMDGLILHEKTKRGLKNLMAARYNGYRYDIRQKYLDPYTTQEERLTHPPMGWPISQWTEMVEYWGDEGYAKKRNQSSVNRGKQVMKHTCGSESIPKKRVEKIRKTGQPVEITDLFVDTHTSKKTNTFVDEDSRVAAEKLQELANQHRDESGNCTASDQQLLDGVFGPGKKGRERMKGHTAGRKKGTITQDDMQRAVEGAVEVVRRENVDQMEALRRENNEKLEALRLETVTNMQAAIQAMIAAGQLLVPPTMPRQDSEARQDTTEDVEE